MSSEIEHKKLNQNNKQINHQINKIIQINCITTTSGFRYYVTQSPDPNNLHNYKDLLVSNDVKTLVKLCDDTIYDTEYLIHNGIKVINIPLQDGTTPSKDVIKNWTNIIKKEMKVKNGSIAVHCVSGLGRAPLFVCVGLILVDKLDPIDAITMVRKTIRSALNTNQINFLETLNHSNGGCVIC